MYAIIENGKVVNVIEADKEFAESIGAIKILDGYGVGDEYSDGKWTKVERSVEIIPAPIDTRTIEEIKQEKILLSKTMLEDFLKNNPLKSDCHGGVVGYYSVTEEKQSLLANNFLAHTLALQAGVPDIMAWNETEKGCTDWTDEETVTLILQMKTYVKPIIAKQQHLEIEINACETIEELNEIEVTYDEFKIT